jgi:hypothetical protein
MLELVLTKVHFFYYDLQYFVDQLPDPPQKVSMSLV